MFLKHFLIKMILIIKYEQSSHYLITPSIYSQYLYTFFKELYFEINFDISTCMYIES